MNLAILGWNRQRTGYVMRLGCCLLCISLLLGLACPLRAHAVVTDTVVIALVAAYLASCGYSLAAHDMNASGTSGAIAKMIQDFLDTELGGVSISQWAEAWYTTEIMIQGGVAYLPAPAANALAQFANWAKGKYGDTPGDNFSIVESIASAKLANGSDFFLTEYYYQGSTCYFKSLGTQISLSDLPLVFASGWYIDRGVANGFEVTQFFRPDGVSFTPYSGLAGGFSVLGFSTSDGQPYLSIGDVTKSSGIFHRFLTISGSAALEFLGDYTSGSSLTIGVLQGLTIPMDLVDGETLKLHLNNPAIDTPDALVDAVIGGVQAGDLTAEAEIVDVADIPIDPPAEPTFPDIDGLGLPALGAALVSRFPFSIPWDVAKGVKLLAAPAKAPYWEVDFLAPISYRVGGWKGDTTVVIDMSEYEIIGQLSRWTSTIGFCLLLASGTKRLIWTA